VAEEPKKPAPSAALGRWRDRLLDGAVLAIPTALVTQSTSWIQGKFFAQPWQILWVAVPLAVVAVVSWKLLRRPDARRIPWRLAVFLIAFASVFAVASASDLLVWKRMPKSEFDGGTGRHWLLPVRLGDWRYWVAPKLPPKPELTVILLDHLPGVDAARLRVRDARLIQAAIAQKVSGVFFDVSYPAHSATDGVLCAAINSATARGVPIITAYRLLKSPTSSLYVPKPPADGAHTPACLLQTESGTTLRGHSMVFADVDGIIRTIPLNWDAAPKHVALAARIAQCMKSKCGGNDLELPDSKLLHFIPTNEDPPTIVGDQEMLAVLAEPESLSGRFLFVGENSPTDTFPTASREKTPGTMIHAYAVNALLAKHYITRPPAWFSAFIVIAACCLVALLASQNAKPRTLLIAAAGASLVVFVLAAAAMALFMVWLDVIYAIVAVWLLVPLLIAYQRAFAAQLAINPRPPGDSAITV
jgi:hypothetical protein